jgi:hypothetical protein
VTVTLTAPSAMRTVGLEVGGGRRPEGLGELTHGVGGRGSRPDAGEGHRWLGDPCRWALPVPDSGTLPRTCVADVVVERAHRAVARPQSPRCPVSGKEMTCQTSADGPAPRAPWAGAISSRCGAASSSTSPRVLHRRRRPARGGSAERGRCSADAGPARRQPRGSAFQHERSGHRAPARPTAREKTTWKVSAPEEPWPRVENELGVVRLQKVAFSTRRRQGTLERGSACRCPHRPAHPLSTRMGRLTGRPGPRAAARVGAEPQTASRLGPLPAPGRGGHQGGIGMARRSSRLSSDLERECGAAREQDTSGDRAALARISHGWPPSSEPRNVAEVRNLPVIPPEDGGHPARSSPSQIL